MLSNRLLSCDDRVLMRAVTPITPAIRALRSEIDELDEQMTALLCRRLTLAQELAEVKSRTGLPIRDKDREASVLDKVRQLSGVTVVSSVIRIYQMILSESRLLQGSPPDLL